MQSLSARNTAEISSRVFTFLPRSHMAAVGAISAVAAGLLNGSWNLPTKPDAPRLVNAALYWEWEQIWLVANVLIVIFNTFLVLGMVGAGTLGDVYRGASSGELGSICAFSLLWGFGGVGYGQAIKRVGMALGTSIVMAQIVCIGTVLPLAFSAADMTTQEIIGSVVGVLLACAGFAMSSRAGLLRDAGDEAGGRARGSRASTTTTAAVVDVEDPVKGASRSTFVESMAWCVAGGVLSSMLQFSFVFGGGLVDDAEERGVAKEASAMPVWMLCFIFNSFGHVFYASWLLKANDTWRKFRSTPARDWAHGGVMCALIAVAFTAHIHLYGLGAAKMGSSGAVFAWPLVMSSTVFTAQVWSLVLGEWTDASLEARVANWASLSLLVAAVAVVALTATL